MSSVTSATAERHERSWSTRCFASTGSTSWSTAFPAVVCGQCGEQTFSRETAEKVRLMVHGEGKAVRSLSMQVFKFAS